MNDEISKSKFNIGDKVIYKGLIATILDKSAYYQTNKICYSLVADEDEELTCTAPEEECEYYDGGDIDQKETLDDIRFNNKLILRLVDNLTDKKLRDGDH